MSQLNEADPWETYDYEKGMFWALVSYFSSGHKELSSLSQPLRFAAVESLVLHTRIIVDILLSRDREDDSIRLEDLLPGFSSSYIDDLKNSYGSSRKKDTPCWIINKRLAHPTKHRLSSTDYSPIINALAPIIKKLFNEIERERQRIESA